MKKVMDGNMACSIASYKFSELAGIYPITPASTMAENVDLFSSNGDENFFSSKVKVVEMQSEAGAIATVHGALQAGVLATTYTASQGLLLMIPNMYKIAGELLPCVINVAARTVATHALSIMGDHSDIYATSKTGFAILASSSVDEIMANTSVAYLSSLKGRVPFVNFFDGFRTSHEYRNVDVLNFDRVKKLIPLDSLEEFRKRGLSTENPTTRGTNMGDQIYFQEVEARNGYYNKFPDIVNDYMMELNEISGLDIKPFNYYGDKNASKVIVAMGSVCETIKETIDFIKDDVGLIEVHLYRPFSVKYLKNVLPKSVKKIAVLDRVKDFGADGEPLYKDVVVALKDLNIEICGGRYGLSSKDTTSGDIYALYKFLDNNSREFTLGITDDVTNLSIKRADINLDNNCDEILIYGYGSDGMITTSKDILTMVASNTKKEVQGYFEYDSKKSGGVTKSHLRFSDNEIRSSYYVTNPSVVVVSKDSYMNKYDVINNIKDNGILIVNTSKDNIDFINKSTLDVLKKKNIKFYVIDASSIARKNNIPNKISMIMECAILYLTKMINYKKVLKLIKESIVNHFSKKGDDVVNSNINAIDDVISNIKEVNVNYINPIDDRLYNTLFDKIFYAKGNDIPVSSFVSSCDGVFDAGMSKYEKRGISDITPCYSKDKCIMCNLCSFVCPHGVIRPYLLDEKEVVNAPSAVLKDLKDANIKDKNYKYTVGISVRDCTGCNLCAGICPTKALEMVKNSLKEEEKYEYLNTVSEKSILPIETVKNSQFRNPKFAFSGACAGCGETPYLKLLTQLFGDDLMIANATGCSSIYGGEVPGTPYDVCFINSLFEDNAEFGLGIKLGSNVLNDRIKNMFRENYKKLNKKNKELAKLYFDNDSKEIKEKVYNEFDYDNFKEIIPYKKDIKEKTVWCVGGDGWAYDIGFGGLDHVISLNYDVNILVLDTEVYSNTGGQASKSTRYGATAKFANAGKKTNKKDLAHIALTYPNCYVATISLGANYMQTIRALKEASEHKGPSIVIAYAPCIAHGIKNGMKDSILEEKLATDSGYFPLFRYNPDTKVMSLDSKADFSKYQDFLKKENRYNVSVVGDSYKIQEEDSIRKYEILEEESKEK